MPEVLLPYLPTSGVTSIYSTLDVLAPPSSSRDPLPCFPLSFFWVISESVHLLSLLGCVLFQFPFDFLCDHESEKSAHIADELG